MPVAVGLVIGGAIAGTLEWRAIFTFLAIYSGAFLFTLVLLLRDFGRLRGPLSRTEAEYHQAYFPDDTRSRFT